MKQFYYILLFVFGLSHVFAQDSISVLFIGNSYVYSNDLPGVLSQLTTNLGKKVTVDSKVNGGYTFQNHVNDAQTYAKIDEKPWDVVVLQGQSQEPSFPDSQVNTSTIPFAMRLADSVYANNTCGNVMYFMTWGRKNGDSQWVGINTFEKMNNRLYNAYMRMADSSNHAMVSPVGSVWAYVRANHPTIELYVPDESHPSPAGTYLAACTFYTSLFQSSPVGATYYGGLDAATAGILQEASAYVLDSLQKFYLHPVSKPTQALFSYVQNNVSVDLTNESIRAESIEWQFGDGTTSIAPNLTHTYTAPGMYDLKLIATSACNVDTFQVQIGIMKIDELDFEGIVIKTTENTFEISSLLNAYELEVVGADGKVIHSKMALDGSVVLERINAPQLLVIYNQSGNRKVIRVY